MENGFIIGKRNQYFLSPSMLNDKTFLGIIPARGGSKGIPGKNIIDLNGKPLIAYTLEAAEHSTLLDRCIVSTDDETIAKIAKEHGGDVPFMRPDTLATDEALALDTLNHAIEELENAGEHYDYILMLQPTSPLRTGEDIDACIRLAVDKNADSVFSMKKLSDFAPQKLKVLEDGLIKPLIEEETGQSDPRHKGPDVYKRNCAVYLTRTELIKAGNQFGEQSYAYEMPEERSIDINDPKDLALTKFWMNKHD